MPFTPTQIQETPLPRPVLQGEVSLEQALYRRRSIRTYQPRSVSLAALGQLLWAAQGITSREGFRTAPSAGALYPMEILLSVARCRELSPGTYLYRPQRHTLVLWQSGDRRTALADAALRQECLYEAAAIVIVTAVPQRTAVKYGRRALRYVHMEAGHVAQNVCLQATALDLGCVTVGAFDDTEVARVLRLPEQVDPLYLLPLGHPS